MPSSSSSRSFSYAPLFSLLRLSALIAVGVSAITLDTNIPDTPPADNLVNVVKDNYFGISFELSSFNSLWGNTTESTPHALINYLGNLKARQTSPLRIRIGGNGMDGSTYDSSYKTQMLQVTDDSYFNAILVKFGPMFFNVLNSVADTVGDMEFVVMTSMQDPSDVDTYLPLAKDAKRILGDRLDAIIVGNEPDLYAGHHVRDGYWLPDYIPEIDTVINQFKDAGLMTDEDTFVAGPGICCMWTLDEVFQAGLDQYPYKYYTAQHYPNHACDGYNAQNTNLTYYRQHSNVREFVTWEQSAVNTAKGRGVSTLLTEYNTAACGGTNISDTFTATLWALDAGLQAAATNYSAAYLHTREHGVRYNLFDPPSPETSYLSNWRTGSPYYAGLVLSEIFSAAGSVVVDLSNSTKISTNSTNSTSPSSSSSFLTDETAVYGIYDNGGTKKGKLVLINYSNGGGSSSNSKNSTKPAVTFRIPSTPSSSSTSSRAFAYRVLTAPSATSRTPNSTDDEFGKESLITWAGQWVGENGELMGDQETKEIPVCSSSSSSSSGGGSGECTVEIEVPSPGAVLVLYDPEREDVFYEGNSTVVGYSSVYHAPPPDGSASALFGGLGGLWAGVMLAVVMGLMELQ